ncbi:MAG: hypothetical protein BSOLF_2530 [Candidatus Carbobacillus altaicus]|uniref:Uncharacterized protein n=1 Tax=Candidatus Carbonibacillus altaicus TaxID=2163959 RepID=A0A2R6Y2E1_9BACL|nr:MAG: hypothetical protein BSOLF_2530 [Candidatus Carbobacillus altaicus]
MVQGTDSIHQVVFYLAGGGGTFLRQKTNMARQHLTGTVRNNHPILRFLFHARPHQ